MSSVNDEDRTVEGGPAPSGDFQHVEGAKQPQPCRSEYETTEAIPATDSSSPDTEYDLAGHANRDATIPREDAPATHRPLGDGTLDYGSEELPTMAAAVDAGSAGASSAQNAEFSIGSAQAEEAAGDAEMPGYKILGELGRGGMGVVYKARQVKLNRLVALKMVLAGAHAGTLQLARFHTEAEAVAQLHHPNIVQVYEVGQQSGLPYFSLEYVDGGTLTQKIAGKPQPPREAAATVESLAGAMAAAHERGIIHRDLKPANILLTKEGQPKITDFGLAKRLEDDSALTKSGTLMGTPSYMSPEQARGATHDIGPPADQYSLGAILYELLTGRPPFVGTTMLETLSQVRTQEPVPPTRLQPKCPRDLETICLKCLQKEPHKRYAGCQALAEDLHCFLAGEPIKARPVSWVERAWRWCRRNPRVAVLSGAVGLLLLAVVVSLAIIGVRLGKEREAVAASRETAGQRLDQAKAAVAEGNYRRAQDLLQLSDPLLGSNPALRDVRLELDELKARVDVYAEFKQRLDDVRFACWFGTRRQQQDSRRHYRELLGLYDEIEGHTGRGKAGLPALNPEQEQLFKEDVFEAFLIAGQMERDLAAGTGAAAERQAAQQALDWFNRAEQVLPGTRVLRVNRAPCWAKLGNAEADRADVEQAKAIPPTSAVDHFWHGYADHRRGDAARAAKDLKAAEESYRHEMAEYAAFLQLRPDHFWGYFNWANGHMQLAAMANEKRDLYDALIGFTACVRLRPDFPWPYNNRGTAHLRLEHFEPAVADFTAALERNPAYREAHANRGLAYVRLGKTDLALEDFSQAIALDPDYALAYTERAELHRKRKQYDEAIQDYGRLLALDSKNLQIRGARVDLLLLRERYAEARDDLTVILDAVPKSGRARRMRAVVNWQKLKDFDAALADFEQFALLAPKDPEPHRCIGAIRLGRRQYGPALAALQKALDLRPGYPEALWARAQILLWQGKPEEALKELDRLVAKLPEVPPETLNVRAGVYQAMGRLDEAEADYRRLIELKPKGPDANLYLAEAYVGLARLEDRPGRSGKGAAYLDRLVKEAAESEWAYIRRAEYRRDRGDHDAALEDCDQAARVNPGWSVPSLVRASIEAARGRPSAGVAQAERALEKAPKYDGHVLYTAACVWSLASRAANEPDLARRYADRAAGLLTEALDKGFHDLCFPEHNRLADDPALAPIRGDVRVRDLIDHRP
jgi:tetratricopeptide (TPR) repeat protein/tRNA A-37 threonylcarbamoyl transferase component Bud32